MRGTGFAQGSVPVADADEMHPELDRTFRNSVLRTSHRNIT
jgi:hypothetical protein